MKAFLAIKYYDNAENRKLIEDLSDALKIKNIETFVFTRDVEKFKPLDFSPKELMERAFAEIDKCDLLIIEASETSIGIGIEAGYAYTKNIPVYMIAKEGSKVSNSIKGISDKIVYYNNPSDILELFK